MGLISIEFHLAPVSSSEVVVRARGGSITVTYLRSASKSLTIPMREMKMAMIGGPTTIPMRPNA